MKTKKNIQIPFYIFKILMELISSMSYDDIYNFLEDERTTQALQDWYFANRSQTHE